MHSDEQHAMFLHDLQKCMTVDGGILDNVLYWVKYTYFVT